MRYLFLMLAIALFVFSCGDSDGSSDKRSQQIEGVAFDYTTGFDFFTNSFKTDLFAIVLFKDGTACRDTGILISDMSVEEHRTQYPNRWYRWKRSKNGSLLYAPGDTENWKKAEYKDAYPPLPEGKKLNKAYSRTNWTGPVIIGTSVAVSNTLVFSGNGRFVAGRSVSATTQGPLIADSGFTGIPANEQGAYYINGYRLTLQYDDGTVREMSIITDEQDNPRTIWLNGVDYNS